MKKVIILSITVALLVFGGVVLADSLTTQPVDISQFGTIQTTTSPNVSTTQIDSNTIAVTNTITQVVKYNQKTLLQAKQNLLNQQQILQGKIDQINTILAEFPSN